MKEGDIVLVPLPQADGQRKPRPAVILRFVPPFGDVLVCGVSSQLRRYVRDFDELIRQGESDFASSGLAADSLIRLGFLAEYAPTQISGVSGHIAPQRHANLLAK